MTSTIFLNCHFSADERDREWYFGGQYTEALPSRGPRQTDLAAVVTDGSVSFYAASIKWWCCEDLVAPQPQRPPLAMHFSIALSLFLTALKATTAKPLRAKPTLLVFGDSKTDNGNSYLLTNKTWPADPAYYTGVFSNGPTWPFYLAPLIGASHIINHAYASATVNNSIAAGVGGVNFDIPIPSVTDQVAEFIASGQEERCRKPETLVVLYIGANDAFFGGPTLDVAALTTSLLRNVQLLVDQGFRRFLLSGSQDNVLQPFYAMPSVDQAARDALGAYSKNWKGNITTALAQARFPRSVVVTLWDEYAAVKAIKEEAVETGVDVTVPCLQGAFGEVAERKLCADPAQHLFFDTYHPSTLMHASVARSIHAAL
ncbi:hypothetical protein BKA62DRAFT_697027 [Auriculariales sp. MPI-PUGE-AT-0066]|nr:hypothetical protein BKA62DRAFT_697027 [Auriculariales sp. MPI-PUGE-AT-0066]